jgi:hypothetical protein
MTMRWIGDARLPVTRSSGNVLQQIFVGVTISVLITELGGPWRRRMVLHDGDKGQVWSLDECVGGITRAVLEGWKVKIGVKALTDR